MGVGTLLSPRWPSYPLPLAFVAWSPCWLSSALGVSLSSPPRPDPVLAVPMHGSALVIQPRARQEAEGFVEYARALLDYLLTLEQRLFSEGLHTLGTAPSASDTEQYLAAYYGDQLPSEVRPPGSVGV